MGLRIPAWMRANLKRQVESLFTEDVRIERAVDATGSYGEQVRNWQVVVVVKGRVIRAGGQGINGGMQGSAGKSLMTQSARLIVPAGTPLGVGARVAIDGEVYYVTALMDQLTDALDMQALIERWRGDAG